MSLSVEIENILNEVNIDEIDTEGFKELLSKISVELDLPNDAKTLLYSGEMNKINTLDVVKQIKGVRLIRDTALGKYGRNKKIEFIDSTLDDMIVSVYGENDAVMFSKSNGNVVVFDGLRDIAGNDFIF